MKLSLRDRLLAVVVLGLIAAALPVVALVRIISISSAQRLERAHDAVVEEVDRLERLPFADRGEIPGPTTGTVVGMRGGYWDGAAPLASLPVAWRAPLASLSTAAVAGPGRRVVAVPVEGSVLVLAAAPAPPGGLAWAGYPVSPSPNLRWWQIIVAALTFTSALLVATALSAVVKVKRSAASLNASLLTLATDLSVPIPRPDIRELGEVADGIANLARNLADAREKEERLGRELADRERLAALGRVVAGVAHEVRNPLASIKLRLDLAAASASLPEVAERAITNASSEIARLDRLVADLLVVAGRNVGPRHAVALGPLLRARAELLAPWAAEREVAIAVAGDASASVDGSSMARAIDNLLRNAVEASPVGGAVEVSVVVVQESVRIHVDDRGAGVPAVRAAELFEPFFTTKSDGTGLGLAISRSIARAHGGDVGYDRRGAVTRFELSFPVAATPPLAAAPLSAGAHASAAAPLPAGAPVASPVARTAAAGAR